MTVEPRNTGSGIAKRVAKARASFRSGRTRPVSWRRSQLEALKRLLKEEESAIFEALWADLRKPRLEGYLTEIGFVIAEIDDTLQHLDRWMKPERKHPPRAFPTPEESAPVGPGSVYSSILSTIK